MVRLVLVIVCLLLASFLFFRKVFSVQCSAWDPGQPGGDDGEGQGGDVGGEGQPGGDDGEGQGGYIGGEERAGLD